MSELANLQIRVDSQGVQQAERELSKLETQSEKAEAKVRALSAQSIKANATIASLAVKSAKAESEFKKLSGQTSTAKKALDTLSASAANSGKMSGSMAGQIEKASDEFNQLSLKTEAARQKIASIAAQSGKAESDIAQFAKASDRATKDVKDLGVKSDAARSHLKQLESQSSKTEKAAAGVGKGGKKGKQGLKELETQSRKTESAADGLERGVRRAGGAIAAYFSVQAVIGVVKMADSYGLLESRVARLTDSAAEAADTFGALTDIAVSTGADMKGTIQLWENLDQTLSEFGKSSDEILQLTENLNKMGVIGGSSVDEMKNSMRQFGQAMAGGIMRAEEFNSIIENTPEVARSMARGMDMSMGEMRMALLAGELTAERVFDSLMSQTDDVNTEFGKMPRTIAQASTALSTQFGVAIADINQEVGASSNIVKFMDMLAGSLGAGSDTAFKQVSEDLDEAIEKRQYFMDMLDNMKEFGGGIGIWEALTGGARSKSQAQADLKEAEAEYDKALKAFVDLQNLRRGINQDDGGGNDKPTKVDPAGMEYVAELDERKEAVRQANMDELALLDEKQSAEMEKLKSFLQTKNITKEQFAASSLDIDRIYADERDKINEGSGNEQAKLEEAADAYLNTIRERNLSEIELLDEKEQTELDKLDSLLAQKLVSEQEHMAAVIEIGTNYNSEHARLAQERAEVEEEARIAKEEADKSSLERFIESAEESKETFEGMWGDAFTSFTSGFANSVADSIVDGKDFGDAMDGVAKGFAKAMIGSLVEIGAQEMVLWTLRQTLGVATGASALAAITSQATTQVFMAGLNAFTATAAIPIVGPILAPAAAAAATAVAAPMGAAAIAAAATGLAGSRSHGGQVMGGSAYKGAEFGMEMFQGQSGASYFIPPENGMVIPNHKTQSGSDGINAITLSPQIVVESGASQTNDAFLAEDIAAAVFNMVLSDANTGGVLSRTLRGR